MLYINLIGIKYHSLHAAFAVFILVTVFKCILLWAVYKYTQKLLQNRLMDFDATG